MCSHTILALAHMHSGSEKERRRERACILYTNLCIFNAKLLSHFIGSHMYFESEEYFPFGMDREKEKKTNTQNKYK